LGGCHWFGGRFGLGGIGTFLSGRFCGVWLGMCLWRWAVAEGGARGVAEVVGLVAVLATAPTPAAAAAREELTWEAVDADLFWPVGGSSALG